MVTDMHRVGGRPGNQPHPGRGGGYQDICRILGEIEKKSGKKIEKNKKLTIDDLKQLELSPRWVKIAERVGIDAWLDIWEILDAENINTPSTQRYPCRLRVPMFTKLVRFLRNQHIEKMIKAGHDVRKIHAGLVAANVEPVSIPYLFTMKNNLLKKTVPHDK